MARRRCGPAGRRGSASHAPGACAGAAGPPILARVRIYTRTGDDGSTGLLGPDRVSKHAPRVEAYGTVDELNAVLGRARATAPGHPLDPELARIQAELFQCGAELATPDPAALARLTRLADDAVSALESAIDRLEADLAPLTSFVLPGGAPLAAELHVARTVCRRAERRVVALAAVEPLEPRLVRYLNRLADLLFVMARWSNRHAGVEDVAWRGGPGA
jgi:cob(I)alamin adenosyltransferase